MNIKFYSTIKKLEEKNRLLRAWREGPNDIRTQRQPLGWYMLLEGSYEYIYVGNTKPDGFAVGQRVEVIIQPADDQPAIKEVA